MGAIFLLIEFAAKKADLIAIQDEILSAIQHKRIVIEQSSLPAPEMIGSPFGSPIESAFSRYEWRLDILSAIDESTLESLRKEFSNKEVHSIRLEDKS